MLKVRDIMTQDVVVIQDSATVAQAIALMQHHRVRSLIVVHTDQRTGYGIVTERDVVYRVIALAKDTSQIGVRAIVREPCITAHPDLSQEDIAQLFAATGIQRAPVIQEQKLVGIVSVTDLLMKTHKNSPLPTDGLSYQIEEALQHAQIICGDLQSQVSQECALVWDVFEEYENDSLRDNCDSLQKLPEGTL